MYQHILKTSLESLCNITINTHACVFNILQLPGGRIASELCYTINIWRLINIDSYEIDGEINHDNKIINCSAVLPDGKIITGMQNLSGQNNKGLMNVFKTQKKYLLNNINDNFVSPNFVFGLGLGDAEEIMFVGSLPPPDGRIISISDTGVLKLWS